jgi:hypothetical protein
MNTIFIDRWTHFLAICDLSLHETQDRGSSVLSRRRLRWAREARSARRGRTDSEELLLCFVEFYRKSVIFENRQQQLCSELLRPEGLKYDRLLSKEGVRYEFPGRLEKLVVS